MCKSREYSRFWWCTREDQERESIIRTARSYLVVSQSQMETITYASGSLFFTVFVKRKIGSFFTLCILNQRKRLERYLSMIKNLGTRIIGILILLCMFHLTCNSFVVMSKASFSLSNERWNETGFLFLSVFSRYPMHIVRSLNRADIHAWLVPNWGHFFFVYQYSPPIFKIRMT